MLRRSYQEEGRQLARERGCSYAAGCMFIGPRAQRGVTPSRSPTADPELFVTFANFLQLEFDVRPDQMKLTCNLFADHVERQHAIESYWLDRLGLPRSSLRKSTVNVYSSTKQEDSYREKLPVGTSCAGAAQHPIVQTIYGSIQEYGGFERPEWLNWVAVRSTSALISAPSSNAIPLIHSHVSITITAESAPHVLLYDANVAV